MRGFVASLGAAYIAYIVAAYVSTLPRAPSSRLPQADGLCSGVSTADRTAAVPLGPVVHVTVTLALAEALPGSGVEPVPKFDTKCQSSGLMWPPRGLITHIRKALDKVSTFHFFGNRLVPSVRSLTKTPRSSTPLSCPKTHLYRSGLCRTRIWVSNRPAKSTEAKLHTCCPARTWSSSSPAPWRYGIPLR